MDCSVHLIKTAGENVLNEKSGGIGACDLNVTFQVMTGFRPRH